MREKPAISVCIPTRNGATWIDSTVRSALASGEDVEVVISDDASTDETARIATCFADNRVRFVPSQRRLGMAANWNRAITLSTGRYVKLLMQDDSLLPGALTRQAELLDRHPTAGLAFGPRQIEHDGSKTARRWASKYGELRWPLVAKRELVPGPEAIRDRTRWRLRANLIGEPSCVLLRRSTLLTTGMFARDLRQLTDFDLWLRIAAVADLAYDSEPVAVFRVHASSATQRNRATGDAWLDQLRIVRGLQARAQTRTLIGPTHYLAAIAAGITDVARGLGTRRKSLAEAADDLRDYLRPTA